MVLIKAKRRANCQDVVSSFASCLNRSQADAARDKARLKAVGPLGEVLDIDSLLLSSIQAKVE